MTIHSSSKNWKLYVKQAAVEVDTKFPRKDWTSTYPGHGEHSAVGAYAVDFMVSDRDLGNKIAAYLWANRVRLNVWYIIFWGKIISRTPGRGTWRRYFDADNPNPSRSHKNHVHVSFYVTSNNAYKPPVRAPQPPVVQVPTPEPTKPVEAPYKAPTSNMVYVDKLKAGTKGSDSVWYLQKQLKITTDGDYGPVTVEAVKKWQKSIGDTAADGNMGPKQTRLLFEGTGIKVEDES